MCNMVEELSFKSSILSQEEERLAVKFIRESALDCVVGFITNGGIDLSAGQRAECEYQVSLLLADAVEYGKAIS